MWSTFICYHKQWLKNTKQKDPCRFIFYSAKRRAKLEGLPFNITKEDVINTLYKSSNNNWQVIVGEYMNKAKKDENKALFNHKFVIHDILCFDGDYLIGKSLQSRIDLMNGLYIKSELNDTLYTTESDNFYVVKTYSNEFTNIYNKIITVDCIEGLVIKRANAPLEIGLTEDNNSKTMVKSRKPEKNYRF